VAGVSIFKTLHLFLFFFMSSFDNHLVSRTK
jgi:hypothetical protein